MTQPGAIDTSIRTLGTPKLTSRLPYRTWVDDVRLPIQVDRELCDEFTEPVRLDFEAAGPRKKLYFDPSRAKCAIVTCGGLCPGLNDVIRAIVMEAHHAYHVPSIMGIRYGLEGFIPACGHQPMELTPERVADIHRFGGTILGSSRGPQSAEEIVDSLERSNVSILFVIGGDGSMKAALSISREVQARNLKIAVIGIPKTIDNDINFIPQSFGFETAVFKATEAIECAHTEARGMPNGIGLVKLMGRESGFIAAQATLAMKEVNFVLVPEAPFTLEGEGGLLPALEERLKSRHHAVIVAAEGAASTCWTVPAPPTPRATCCWATWPTCCAPRSNATWTRAASPTRSNTSTPATSSVPYRPRPMTRSIAASWVSMPSMRPWPGAPTWWWARSRTATCTCRWSW